MDKKVHLIGKPCSSSIENGVEILTVGGLSKSIGFSLKKPT